MKHRTWISAAAVAGAIVLTGCQDETKLTQLDQSGSTDEELIGREITLENEVGEVYGDEFVTMGEEKTLVFVKDMPDDIKAGDDVRATGTVEERDVFTGEKDREHLNTMTDTGTANYLVDRDSELILTDATITKTD